MTGLPSYGPKLPLPLVRRIDEVCDEFQSSLVGGEEPPRLEVFLQRVDASGRRALLRELVILAVEHFEGQGLDEPVERLREANPEHSEEIRLLFSDELSTAIHASSKTSPGVGLKVRCPTCHAPVEVAPDASLESIVCPACETDFSLVTAEEATERAATISQLGHFRLVERVGMGAFGSVWRAHDTKLDRTVAVKIPRKGQFDSRQEKAFLAEAQSAAQLGHPGIVPVYEVGRDDDTLYIVSEYVRGIDLSRWLDGQRLTGRESAELCLKIAEALHHAHCRGVVHRDLKPGNIMMAADGQPRLMDFGLARRDAGEVTVSVSGHILGTPAYMSPEQARGEASKAGPPSDVYSLGVILFQLLTGERPFRGSTPMLLDQVIHDPPPSPRKFNATVPQDLETLVLRCLEKDPAQRYASAEDLAAELRRFLAGEPILSRPVGAVEKAWRWSRRHKARASAFVLLAGLAVAMVGWGLREVTLTRTLRYQLSENLAKSAELHGRKGEWADALVLIDQAISHGSRDPIRLRLDRIAALESLNQQAEATEELEALARRTDLGVHKGEVRMMLGLNRLASDGISAAEPLLREAVSLGGLPESKQATAECLLAETSTQALAAARRAVDADGYEQESRRYLVLMLHNLGYREEARQAADAAKMLFPDDPNFPLLLAGVAESEGDKAGIDKHLNHQAIQQLDRETIEHYRRLLHKMVDYRAKGAEFWDFAKLRGVSDQAWNRPEIQETLFSRAIKNVQRAPVDQSVSGLVSQLDVVGNMVSPHFGNHSGGFAFSRVIEYGPRCLADAYRPLASFFSARTGGFLEQGKGSTERIDRMIQELEESFRSHPDAFLAYARGQLLYVRGRRVEAAEAFESAAVRPSALGHYRGACLFAAARCRYELSLDSKANDSALAKAAAHTRSRLAAGPLEPHHAEALYEIAVAFRDYDATKSLVATLEAHGLEKNECRVRHAAAELAAENFVAAIRYASQVDVEADQYGEAQAIATKGRGALRSLVIPASDAAG